jgi:hypothetical protein
MGSRSVCDIGSGLTVYDDRVGRLVTGGAVLVSQAGPGDRYYIDESTIVRRRADCEAPH